MVVSVNICIYILLKQYYEHLHSFSLHCLFLQTVKNTFEYLQLNHLLSLGLEYSLHMHLGFMAARIYPFLFY